MTEEYLAAWNDPENAEWRAQAAAKGIHGPHIDGRSRALPVDWADVAAQGEDFAKVVMPRETVEQLAEDQRNADKARMAGRQEALALVLDLMATAKNPRLRALAWRYIANPCSGSIATIATEAGVSESTVKRELNVLRNLRMTPSQTESV